MKLSASPSCRANKQKGWGRTQFPSTLFSWGHIQLFHRPPERYLLFFQSCMHINVSPITKHKHDHWFNCPATAFTEAYFKCFLVYHLQNFVNKPFRRKSLSCIFNKNVTWIISPTITLKWTCWLMVSSQLQVSLFDSASESHGFQPILVVLLLHLSKPVEKLDNGWAGNALASLPWVLILVPPVERILRYDILIIQHVKEYT